MDGNKDEALKCLRIGREALGAGDRSRALKFISKARRLDPSLDIDGLLSSLDGDSSTTRDSDSAQNSGVCDEGAGSSKKEPLGIPSLRKRGGGSASGSANSTNSVNYTQEQISIVREIKKQKDYYEILGVEKSCSVEEVRKAYRKLSLKVHPDKNKAPGSEEAFKAVSKAFQCLSDEEKRKKYDVSGSDEVVYERATARRGQRQQGFNGFYEADFDPDEIFRNFFYGGVPGATTQFSGFTFGTGMGPSMRTGTANHTSSNSNLRAIIQLLPILLVLLLNFLPSNEPVYSLQRTYQYDYRFATMRGVDYFVKSSKFEQEYPPDSPQRLKLEVQIDREYYSIVSQNCRHEMQRRDWGLSRETPHCELLQKFRDGVAT